MSETPTQSLGFNLSKDPEAEGFDLQAGQTWVFPTNYPIRDYQFNIVQKALLNNTLVSLPTGLGKTFIAAVVMYNFFRWYPMGKVVFMAPTRPLVKQQIDACYDIMAIPKETTVELTGTKLATSRGNIWKEKRVFFVTPQILQNDLETLEELGTKIKCVVFDEAHRARGNHAYCEVIRKLGMRNKYFRVLALSATPGSTVGDVLEVVQNLLISHLEFRTEDSLDVHPYVFKRNLTTIVVPFGEKLQQVRDDYLQILEYYTKTLIKYNVIQGNCGNLTKGKIFMTMKEFQRNRTSSSPNYAEIMKSLNICVTLYHAFELLTRHGLRSFVSFFTEHIDKPLLRGNTRLVQIVYDVKDYLGPELNVNPLPDGSYPEIPKTVKFGHPKFYKLRDVLLSHFVDADASSRVIVFFEYRNSVTEAYALLIQARPLLKPRIFLGQGHGVTQRQQLNVVKSFREGQCNVLLSTCIGEEGLDVGNVDLIVCFDLSNKSPIRMVQRMGRTGRNKEGHIIVLVTEGKEQQILKDCLIHKDNIAFHVLASTEMARGLKASSPRLVPADVMPKCEKIHITVKRTVLTKNSSLKDMFRNASSSSSEPTFSPDLELIEMPEKIPQPRMLWNTDGRLEENRVTSAIFSNRIEKQRSLQPIQQVGHSKASEALTELLQLVDSKRYNIPITQIGTTSQLSQNTNLKQGDIKSMFLRLHTPFDSALTESQTSKFPAIQQNDTENTYRMESKELYTEISNYLSIQTSNSPKKCKLCPDNIDCTTYSPNVPNVTISWIQIDDTIFNTITLNDIKTFTNSLTPSIDFDFNEFNDSVFSDPNIISSIERSEQNDVFNDIKLTQLEKIAEKVIGNADISPEEVEAAIIEENEDADVAFGDKSCAYEAPKNLDMLISRYGTSIIDQVGIREKKSQEKCTLQMNDKRDTINYLKKSPEKRALQMNDKRDSISDLDERELFGFFKLTSFRDLFGAGSGNLDLAQCSQETVIYSPDIIDATFSETSSPDKASMKSKRRSEEELQMSPVIRGINKRRQLKTIMTPKEFTVSNRPLNLKNLKMGDKVGANREIQSPSKFTMNATKISSTPFTLRNELPVKKLSDIAGATVQPSRGKVEDSPKKSQDLNIDDICDLSVFGISPVKTTKNPTSDNSISTSPKNGFDIDDFCDLSSFGINTQATQGDGRGGQQAIQPDATPFCAPGTSDASVTVTKNQSQSQMPITQLLSFINKTEDSPDVVCAEKPAKTSQGGSITENVKGKHDSPTKKSKPSLNRNEDSPGVVCAEKPAKISQSESITENVKGKRDSPTKKSKPSLSRATQSVSVVKPVDRKPRRKNLSALFASISPSNSEDEFEAAPSTSVFKRPRLIDPRSNRTSVVISRTAPARKRSQRKNVFIDDEAEVSEDEDIRVSQDEDETNQSVFEESFIEDKTQHMDMQMHARYLQSLRSPKKLGQFRVHQRPTVITDIFSQEVGHDDDRYIEDSFVVDDNIDATLHELTALEILELELDKQRRQAKRKTSAEGGKSAKRRRIIYISDDSD